MSERIENEELVAQYKMLKRQGNSNQASNVLMRIIENNMGTVNMLVNAVTLERNNITKEDKEDLRQEAAIAIMEAVETYKPSKAQFNTHAYTKIEFVILDWFREKHTTIKISQHMQGYCSQYYKIVNDFKQNNNEKEPSDEYIIKMLGVSKKTFGTIKEALCAYNILSLNEKIETNDAACQLGDVIEDKKDSFFEIIFQRNKEKLAKAILSLRNERERHVIIEHFYNNVEYKDIAKGYNVSQARINTIKNNAFDHLRQMPEITNIAVEINIITDKNPG